MKSIIKILLTFIIVVALVIVQFRNITFAEEKDVGSEINGEDYSWHLLELVDEGGSVVQIWNIPDRKNSEKIPLILVHGLNSEDEEDDYKARWGTFLDYICEYGSNILENWNPEFNSVPFSRI